MNPYVTLGVPANASDQQIRQAYLDAVKRSPPDTDPAGFQAAHAAYELIRDEPRRIRHYLFRQDCEGHTPFDAFLRHMRAHEHPKPPSFDALKEILRSCLKT
jgi:curved DNA-binding protein CbpA